MPDYAIEAAIGGLVCGVDEAGRGPWAGPVVAAAVVLDGGGLPEKLAAELDDCKRVPRPKREELFAALMEEHAAGRLFFAVAGASVTEIDRVNILRATFKAMSRAVAGLGCAPDHAIVDGNGLPDGLPCPARAVIGGDGLSLSIAAASIIAKVMRDRLMGRLDAAWPGYGFSHNMGYGTEEHWTALRRLGVTPHHRRSFAPVHKILWGE